MATSFRRTGTPLATTLEPPPDDALCAADAAAIGRYAADNRPWDVRAQARAVTVPVHVLVPASGPTLTAELFSVRARVLLGDLARGDAAAFVSGLLIGTEFAAAQASTRAGDTVHLVASSALAGHYARAAECFGMRAVVHDPDTVYLSALQQFFAVLDR